jgi:hypothetical protein
MKKTIDKKQIIKLRKEGLTYEQIGKQVGCSDGYAYQICNPEYKEKNKHGVLKWRKKNKSGYNEYMKILQRKLRKEKKK